MPRLDDPPAQEDQLLSTLRAMNRFAVRSLAVLMTAVILFGVIDVIWTLYLRLREPPVFILTIGDIVGVFGAFIAVLIAIEIFVNITVYLTENVIHVQIVMATALMAIARKVIILDFKDLDPAYVWSTSTVVLAMSVGYYLVNKRDAQNVKEEHGLFTMTNAKPSKANSPESPVPENTDSSQA
ncbi:MAG: phosphate-starvation-inducible PsiE family protein [Thermoguttaceae bacterium]|jgi:uncharacterized membrane protein (DUF373 family)|nr:phosphate-starvation-inducible PsiE family protein [Thermoguttaceae bacterium]